MNKRTENPMDQIGQVPKCQHCGSERVVRDAWACWNREAGLWELETALDQQWCHGCQQETTFAWHRPDQTGNKAIRELNDALRMHAEGNGEILITAAVSAGGPAFVAKVAAAVQTFDAFTEDNDPYGEHDFGAVDVDDQKVFWKIDYYDLAMAGGSENPANPGVTRRVLTIMLAEEY